MEQVPEEVLLNIVHKTSLEDLPNLCQSNAQYRRICGDSSLWKVIFRREKLPLLQEGSDFYSWATIYRASVLAKEMAEYVIKLQEEINLPRLIIFPVALSAVSSATHIALPNVVPKEDIVPFIASDLLASQIENLEREALAAGNDPLAQRSLLPLIGKSPPRYSLTISIREGLTNYEILSQDKIIYTVVLSRTNLKLLLYKLAYYGLLKINPDVYRKRQVMRNATQSIRSTMVRSN